MGDSGSSCGLLVASIDRFGGVRNSGIEVLVSGKLLQGNSGSHEGGVTEFLGSGGLGRVLGYLDRRMGLWLLTSASLRDIAQARRSPIVTVALRIFVHFACLPTFIHLYRWIF